MVVPPLKEMENRRSPKRIFIKYGPDVKRVDLPEALSSVVNKVDGGDDASSSSSSSSSTVSMNDLVKLFMTRFDLPAELQVLTQNGQRFPLYIQDRQSQVWYELEDAHDLYESAVVELRKPDHLSKPRGSTQAPPLHLLFYFCYFLLRYLFWLF